MRNILILSLFGLIFTLFLTPAIAYLPIANNVTVSCGGTCYGDNNFWADRNNENFYLLTGQNQFSIWKWNSTFGSHTGTTEYKHLIYQSCGDNAERRIYQYTNSIMLPNMSEDYMYFGYGGQSGAIYYAVINWTHCMEYHNFSFWNDTIYSVPALAQIGNVNNTTISIGYALYNFTGSWIKDYNMGHASNLYSIAMNPDDDSHAWIIWRNPANYTRYVQYVDTNSGDIEISFYAPDTWGFGSDRLAWSGGDYLQILDETTNYLYIYNVSISDISESNISSITPIYPLTDELTIGTSLNLQARLISEYNGTINWYVDDVLEDTTTFLDAPIFENTTFYVYGLVQDLDDGEHTWYANFTSTQNFSWWFEPVSFNSSSGLIPEMNLYINDILGTSGNTGLYLIIMIIILFVSSVTGIYTKNGAVFIGSSIFMTIIFALTGLLPAWITIIYIVIAGFVMVMFYRNSLGGG